VLSLKRAQISIAMQSGSQATARRGGYYSLLNDSFAATAFGLQEGQHIVMGMLDIIRLFLTRVVYQALIIVARGVIGLGFRYAGASIMLSLITVRF